MSNRTQPMRLCILFIAIVVAFVGSSRTFASQGVSVAAPTAKLVSAPGPHLLGHVIIGKQSPQDFTQAAKKSLPRARSFTFVNKTSKTIWVAGSQQASGPVLSRSGWVLRAGHKVTIKVPDHWNGRFWGRTWCHFNHAGHGRCATGDCNKQFQCHGSGQIPATLAEFDINSFDHLDFYDVSMVDGSNLPMYINTFGGTTKDRIKPDGCSVAGCTKPVQCPGVLRVHSKGAVVGCISACARLGTDPYCCRGPWASRSVCIPSRWPVDYAAVFKSAEPYAYSYVYDDQTSTFTCSGGCNYRITFGLTPAGCNYARCPSRLSRGYLRA